MRFAITISTWNVWFTRSNQSDLALEVDNDRGARDALTLRRNGRAVATVSRDALARALRKLDAAEKAEDLAR